MQSPDFQLADDSRPVQPHDLPKARRTILLLPGEKAGMRACVQTVLVPIPTPQYITV